jgi:hypothetical protein
VVVKIDPYSQHRNFYWVELDDEAHQILGIRQISVFNPKNLVRIKVLAQSRNVTHSPK